MNNYFHVQFKKLELINNGIINRSFIIFVAFNNRALKRFFHFLKPLGVCCTSVGFLFLLQIPYQLFLFWDDAASETMVCVTVSRAFLFMSLFIHAIKYVKYQRERIIILNDYKRKLWFLHCSSNTLLL